MHNFVLFFRRMWDVFPRSEKSSRQILTKMSRVCKKVAKTTEECWEDSAINYQFSQ